MIHFSMIFYFAQFSVRFSIATSLVNVIQEAPMSVVKRGISSHRHTFQGFTRFAKFCLSLLVQRVSSMPFSCAEFSSQLSSVPFSFAAVHDEDVEICSHGEASACACA